MGIRIGRGVAGATLVIALILASGLPVFAATSSATSSASTSSSSGSASGASSSSSSSTTTTSTSSATSSSSSSTSSAKAKAKSALALPPVPAGLSESGVAPIMEPVSSAIASVNNLQSVSLDSAVLPPSILDQRTYASTLAQWEEQGAAPVPASTQIVINAADYTSAAQPAAGQPSVSVESGVGGNPASVLAWPDSVPYVDYSINVPATGLYDLSLHYYLYPSCYTATQATSLQQYIADSSIAPTNAFCGKQETAARSIAIDPPGTVPQSQMVETEAPETLPSCIVAAAASAGLSPSQLPVFMNPTEDASTLPDSPAWTVPAGTAVIQPTAPPCPNGQTSSTSGATSGTTSGTASATSSTSATSATTVTTSANASGTSSGAATTTTPSTAATTTTTTVPTNGPNACALNLNTSTGPTSYDGFEYSEAKQVDFATAWEDVGTKQLSNGTVLFQKDNQGDELLPLTQQVPNTWQTAFATDDQGIYGTPLQFCLTKGEHVLQIGMVNGPMAVQSITLEGAATLPTYAQYLASAEASGMKPVPSSVKPISVEAADMYQMSSGSIQPGDTGNPGVTPVAHGYYVLNELNGQYWQEGNEWIKWKITVPASGLYQLGFKVEQPAMEGLPVTRELTIDGSLPFQGAQWVAFPFADHWAIDTLAQPNGKPALIALTKGTHVIRLKVEMGLLGTVLTNLNQISQTMSELQREIELVTGSDPSPNVNYNLPQNVPNLIPTMQDLITALNQQAALLTYDAGGHEPAAAASLTMVVKDLTRYMNNPSLIQLNISAGGEWTNDEQSLATWVTTYEAQPLYMNWLAVASPSYHWPPAGAGVLKQVGAFWEGFITSFFRNYTGIGNTYKQAVEVWAGWGQTWVDLMSELTDSEFTPLTGIKVNFDTIPGGSGIVLLSEIAGDSPDVATGEPSTDPLNWGMRGGAYNLQNFPNWNLVKTWFLPDALEPDTFTNAKGQTGVYGLPETQGMDLMFYRTDILQSLGLSVPLSWQDLLNMMPILAAHGMSISYGGGLFPFLYQLGGQYYVQGSDGVVSALSPGSGSAAYSAFLDWTNLYTEWDVPLNANFFTEFQTGQLPIGIGTYGQYVQLQTGAPDIQGLWSIARIPGMVYDCQPGKVDCQLANPQVDCTQSQLSAGTCYYNYESNGGEASTVVMIPKSAKDPTQAWDWVEWWESASTQLQFADDLEAVGGVQAAWNTANRYALEGLPWPESALQVFEQVWSQYVPTPVVPGGFITDRYLNDIFNNVVLDGENARQQLEWAVENIDNELFQQEVQYGLASLKNGQSQFQLPTA